MGAGTGIHAGQGESTRGKGNRGGARQWGARQMGGRVIGAGEGIGRRRANSTPGSRPRTHSAAQSRARRSPPHCSDCPGPGPARDRGCAAEAPVLSPVPHSPRRGGGATTRAHISRGGRCDSCPGSAPVATCSTEELGGNVVIGGDPVGEGDPAVIGPETLGRVAAAHPRPRARQRPGRQTTAMAGPQHTDRLRQ